VPRRRFSVKQVVNHLREADVRLAPVLAALTFTLTLISSQLSAAERLMPGTLLDRHGADKVTSPDCKPSSLSLELTLASMGRS
jgi:hypothetical protein